MRALQADPRARAAVVDDRVIADDIEAVKALIQAGAVG